MWITTHVEDEKVVQEGEKEFEMEKDELRNIRKVGRNEGRKNRMRVGGDRTKYWRREKKRT